MKDAQQCTMPIGLTVETTVYRRMENEANFVSNMDIPKQV